MNISRRNFIGRSAAAVATGIVAPSLLNGQKIFVSPAAANDKIGVALIGCRGMGWSDLSDFLIHPEIECLALCDIDENVLNSRVAEVEKWKNKKPAAYGDYRKMLERKDIDAVIIGTPDHWHCLQMVDACSAGKDVYVEKPIANSIAECDAMVAAAKKYNRVVQVGQQQRSGDHWHEMKKYIDSGKLGKIAQVDVWANFNYANILHAVPDSSAPAGVDFDRWLGPAPLRTFNEKRFHGLWRMFWDYGGGLMTDWGVHLLDMALWGMNVGGMPNRIFASGANFAYPDNIAETFGDLSVIYEFDDFTIQWNNLAGTETGPYGRNYGLAFKGTNGTLVANREGWEVLPDQNKIEPVSVQPDYEDHKKHVAQFIRCMKDRDMHTACPIENGSLCAKYAHLGNISARIKSELVYDDVKKKFNNSSANKLIRPTYRKPWIFPTL